MVQSRCIVHGLCILGVCMTLQSLASAQRPAVPKTQRQLQIELSQQRERKLAALLQDATLDQLRALKRSPDVSLCLMAAWHELQGELKSKSIPVGFAGRRIPAALIPDCKKQIQRYIGFVEGRTSASVPEIWELAVEQGLFHRCNSSPEAPHDPGSKAEKLPATNWVEQLRIANWVRHSWFSDPDGDDVYTERVIIGIGVTTAPGTVITAAGDQLVITVGSKRIGIARTIVEDFAAAIDSTLRCRAWFIDDCVYVLFLDSQGTPSPLFCIDQPTGEIVWTQILWALGSDDGGRVTGLRAQVSDVVLQVDGRHVTLFAWGDAHFIEQFDRETGQPQFRWTST